jgi:uncharacterized membrane protein
VQSGPLMSEQPSPSRQKTFPVSLSNKQLGRWFWAALVLVVLGLVFATTEIDFQSSFWLLFRAVFGLVAAVVVIGFYVAMFAEAARSEVGLKNACAVALFILLPIGSAFLYYWWTRYVRNGG